MTQIEKNGFNKVNPKKFKKEETIELSLMDARLIYEHLCTYETYDFHDRITQLGIGRLCVILKKKI
mgnify:CR=1 FL=1